MDQPSPSDGSSRWAAHAWERIRSCGTVLLGLVVVILYFGRDTWAELLAEPVARRLGWRVWVAEWLVWGMVFLVLGLIGALLWGLGWVEDEPATPPVPNKHGKCPKCGFEYRWDGARCGHCGFTKQA